VIRVYGGEANVAAGALRSRVTTATVLRKEGIEGWFFIHSLPTINLKALARPQGTLYTSTCQATKAGDSIMKLLVKARLKLSNAIDKPEEKNSENRKS